MSDNIVDTIAGHYRTTHEQVLKLVDRLEDAQIRWSPNRTTLSIAFHVWHLARWADYLQETIGEGGVQIWEAEGLAARWSLGDVDTGFAGTGMGMGDGASATLPLPGKDELLDYARRAFAQAEQAVAAIDDDRFHRVVPDRHGGDWGEAEIGDLILTWWKHDNRHLGMIECMLGVMGRHGTATR